MTDSLARRARRLRSHAAVRAWEYRQRAHAHGAWFRLRRLLADAAAAYEVSEDEASRLCAAGCAPHPVGAEFEPERAIFVLAPEALASVRVEREVPLVLSAELLAARRLVLVPFCPPPAA